MWYVIQTKSGKEKELTDVISKSMVNDEYDKCFVIQQECVWRIEGTYRIHIEPLFPSYVFVETATPEKFNFALKKVPKLTKLLGGDGDFWTVQKEEESLLRKFIGGDPDFIVRCSSVQVNEAGEIISADGALKDYLNKIVKKRLRKRQVVIEIPFMKETKRIRLGIRIEGSISL